jgi:protein TonB
MRPGAGGAALGDGDVEAAAQPLGGGYQVTPHYPYSARRRGIEGTVMLKVLVTAQGLVEVVQVERSAGHADLDQSAMEAVRRWRFQPARRRGGEPVAMWVLIPVQYKLL